MKVKSISRFAFLLTVLAASLLTSPAFSAEKAEIETLNNISKLRRARVLLLSDQVSRDATRFVQNTLEDQIMLSRPLGKSGRAEALLATLETLPKGQYELVCFDYQPESRALSGAEKSAYEKTLQSLAKRLEEVASVVMWSPAMSADDPNRELAKELFLRAGVIVGTYEKIVDAEADMHIPAYPIGSDLAGSFVGVMKAALLSKSAPWALQPANDLRDPAFLTTDTVNLEQPHGRKPVRGAETSAIYRALEGEWQFNMHPFIAHHDGLFWVIWSTARVDEDGPSQFIRYATSKDGMSWSEPQTLAPDPDGEKGPLRWMPGGLHSQDGKLRAYGAIHKGSDGKGTVWQDVTLHKFLWTGREWKDKGPMAKDTLIYFPPMKIGDKEFLIKRDSRAGIFTVLFDSKTGEWSEQELPGYLLPRYRMSETSHYVDPEGVIHLLLRDQSRSMRLYHSLSYDKGKTWTVPVQTDYPDAVSKNLSGTLSNGWHYLVNTPLTRRELVISFSRDGWVFKSPLLIRSDPPKLRYKGKHKDPYSYNYSHAIEYDGKLWVVYSVNKEDIEITSFDIARNIPKKYGHASVP